MKSKGLFFIISFIVTFMLILGYGTVVQADSGFDFSYDSGGLSSGGSSSSHHSGGGGFTYYNDLSFDENVILGATIILITIFLIIFRALLKNWGIKKARYEYIPSKKPVRRYFSDEEVRKFIPDFDKTKFLGERYHDYLDVQNAWMNFDYNILKNKLTDELYNQYIFQLDSMKIKGEQNIVSNFTPMRINVVGIRKIGSKLEIVIELGVSFYDYIVRKGKIVRGSKIEKANVIYDITFICDINPVLDKCPKCGAKLNNSSSQVCPYCRSIITRTGKSWVIAKKENIFQER